MSTPRKIVGGLLLVLAALVYLGLITHPESAAPWARVLLSCIAAFLGVQVLLGKRIPGFHWRTRHQID
jgi:Na+/H+ antiporter NhaA